MARDTFLLATQAPDSHRRDAWDTRLSRWVPRRTYAPDLGRKISNLPSTFEDQLGGASVLIGFLLDIVVIAHENISLVNYWKDYPGT
jgi:hypothetical protein